jgi:hypothetical protein
MYSFMTYETGGLRRDRRDDTILFEDLQGCFEIERMMWSHRVINVLPIFEIFVVFSEILGSVCELIIFLPVGSVGSFYATVEFWASGWKDEEPDIAVFTCGLKD